LSCKNEKILTSNLHPSLASIEVHAEAIGHRAVDQLLWRIGHPGEEYDIEILVRPDLVPGESMGKL
ncbi:MAG TPA: substrate-binding domain-containing protein, partial [Oceanipulchritudo sp.]|nr:substrate-binding domain-containing protein [Oceanipulchritudo sp.]